MYPIPRTLVPEPNRDKDWDEVSAYFRQTSAAVFAIALRSARTRSDADEVVQEAYLRI